MRTSLRGNSMKVLASVVLLSGAAGVAGLGTFGAFTATTTASQQVATGTITLNKGTGPQDFNLQVNGMVPGDSIQRSVTLVRGSSDEQFFSLKMSAAGNTANLLTSDASNGLQLLVERCPSQWTTGANSTLVCASKTTALTTRAVVTPSTDLTGVVADLNGAGAKAYLAITVSLPQAAGNTFQNLGNTLTFTFDATQRNGTTV